MKFLAILKDSFREAVDGFVIYVMVGLSTLVILLVACIGYKPVPAEKAFASMLGSLRFVNADRGRSAIHGFPMSGVGFTVSDLQKLNEAELAQEGDYRLRLHIEDTVVGGLGGNRPQIVPKKDRMFFQGVANWAHTPGPNSNPDPDAVTDDLIADFVKDAFETEGNVQVMKIDRLPDVGPTHYVFQVETKGRKGARGWLHQPNLLFGAIEIPIEVPLGVMVYMIQDQLVNGFGAWITLLIAVVLTAFFFPNLMRKGAIDLVLSKPINRVTLLIFKYVGGLTFVFLNTAYAVGGVWLVLGLRSGIWSSGFLLTIFGITFYFAILYAVSTLIGVLTRNAIASILVTIAFWFLMWIVGFVYSFVDLVKHEPGFKDRIPKWVVVTVDTAHAVLPRTKDLDKLTTKLVVQGTLGESDKRRRTLDNLSWPSWGEVLGVSLAHIALMLGLASLRFVKRDF